MGSGEWGDGEVREDKETRRQGDKGNNS